MRLDLSQARDKFADGSIRRALADGPPRRGAKVGRAQSFGGSTSSPMISSRKTLFDDIIAAKAKGSSDKGFFTRLEKVCTGLLLLEYILLLKRVNFFPDCLNIAKLVILYYMANIIFYYIGDYSLSENSEKTSILFCNCTYRDGLR